MIPHTLTPALDYIDPGTGSMLFALLIGLVGVAQFGLKGLLIKAKFRLSGGRDEGHAADALPLVIFSDHKRYWKNFDPVCRELDRRGIDVTYLTASPDDPVLDGPYPHIHGEFIGEGNRAFARMNLLNATMVLATTPGLQVYQWKRSKGVTWYTHMQHGANEMTTYRMFGLDYYDALLVSGQYQIDDTRALEALRELPAKEMELVGIPYFDDIVDNMEGTAARLKLFNVHEIPGEAYEVVHLIDEACACVQTMFDALPEYKTNKTVTEQAVKILDFEDQGDTYYRRGLGNLFIEGADPIHVVKWKSLFDSLERCMDSCKDLANSVLGVVMENA